MASDAEWELARRICSVDLVRWAISIFDPFKAPGTDDIFPALLQKGLDLFAPILIKLFRACLAFGYIPECWQVANPIVGKAKRLQTHQSDILCPQDNGETARQIYKRRTTSSSPPAR